MKQEFVVGDWWGQYVEFTSDGERLAAIDASGQLLLWDVAGRSELRRWTVSSTSIGSNRDLSFHPNGRTLAVSEDSGFAAVLDTHPWGGRRQVEEWLDQETPLNHCDRLDYSGDGKLLACLNVLDMHNNEIQIFDAATRRHHWTISSPNRITDLAFAPDRPVIAFYERQSSEIELVDVDSRTSIGHVDAEHGLTAFVAFSPDGRRLASTGRDGTILIGIAGVDSDRPHRSFHSSELVI